MTDTARRRGARARARVRVATVSQSNRTRAKTPIRRTCTKKLQPLKGLASFSPVPPSPLEMVSSRKRKMTTLARNDKTAPLASCSGLSGKNLSHPSSFSLSFSRLVVSFSPSPFVSLEKTREILLSICQPDLPKRLRRFSQRAKNAKAYVPVKSGNVKRTVFASGRNNDAILGRY